MEVIKWERIGKHERSVGLIIRGSREGLACAGGGYKWGTCCQGPEKLRPEYQAARALDDASPGGGAADGAGNGGSDTRGREEGGTVEGGKG